MKYHSGRKERNISEMDKTKAKRYYWLKLKTTYFSKLEQKKMKRQPKGKDMQLVYLRMMLLSVDKAGYIYYQGVYDTLEEELAEEFDEDVDVIRDTLKYLQDNGMISIGENFDCFIPEALEHIGSECSSAERMRKSRVKRKVSQCDNNVTKSDANVTSSDVEKEIELEKEKEIEKEYNCSEPDKSALNPSGIMLPLNDNTAYEVPSEKITMWEQAYPAVDVKQELYKMISWLNCNPTRRKTRRGVNKFIDSWLAREQDSGKSHRSSNTRQYDFSQLEEQLLDNK